MSALFHACLLGALLEVSSAHKIIAPNHTGAGASAALDGGSPTMTLVFLDLSVAPETSEEIQQDLSSEGLKPEEALLADVASPEPLPPTSVLPSQEGELDSPTLEAQGEAATRAALYGRYLGQIRARIERAWYRPRSGLAEPRFQCQVLIRQSRSGEVEAVELPSCNGDIRWQLSLAQAIQTASPLPAPPDPAVFIGALTLDFESTIFVDGGSEQGFEPASTAVAMADSTPVR